MKDLPVPIDKQREVTVDYVIAKLMNKGIAFKSKQNDVNSRCWIKYYPNQKQFHLTIRFLGKDYITGQGEDKFDIDLYLPFDEFVKKFGEIILIKELDEAKK